MQHSKLYILFCLLFTLINTGTGSAQTLKPDDLKGINIRNIGPGAMSGRITALACDPVQSNIIYAGAASGGLWRSKSGGTNWEPIFDKVATQSIGAIAINPKNPDEIWVGTGEGNPRNSQNFGTGIYKTIDGGKNWSLMGLPNSHSIYRIVINRDNPDMVFAAVMGSTYGPTEERGVYKTTDGGKTWRKSLYVNDLTGCADLVSDPRNPNKLFAAMWEYRRWPWFFKSGGKGSGLYVSNDAGETWSRRTDKDGLPEGELGRIGLAVAKSNPDIVYALVEAKDNALYKSVDGGLKWRQMANRNQGDRPFYYSELYVDPKNANTVYSVHSQITRSIDGGKSFDGWVGYWDIHPDHHAFWINPENPQHIMEGNDGGLNITLDGGKTWRYAENIPVGQFYHVNVDNDMPYNVYGGLQDNGSWVGPSAVWKSGGIRNSDWQELYFGDGFDVSPRPDNNRYVYAMSQGGELAYIDKKSGNTLGIKPLHPEHKKLRFNWNAAFAQNPFSSCGIYYGSQYLHYSEDCGQTWQLISPDLTTADTSKLHQDISGGLTTDATNAENHCTIIAITPSPVQKDLIWVGTDDGNLQLTRDGGKNWENLSERLPEYPKTPWIPQIEVSVKNAGEAFVVVNNYRQNDWQPYLYHTTDFGKKWKRLASTKNVTGFCLSVTQDPEVPNLLFLGTDQGLYISIDYGENWTHWTNETFPSVPVYDMKIQAREADLVIATFGRAFWIMDDIRPLRELAKTGAKVLDKPFKLFAPGPVVMAEMRSFDGPRFAAAATYAGENKNPAIRVVTWVNRDSLSAPKEKEKDKIKDKDKKDKEKETDASKKDKKPEIKKMEKAVACIISQQGDTLRRFKVDLDTSFGYITRGFDSKGVRFPTNGDMNPDEMEPGGGPNLLPGTYKMVVKFGRYTDSVNIELQLDPRIDQTAEDLRVRAETTRDLYKTIERTSKAYSRLREVERTIKLVEDQFINVPDSLKKDAVKSGTALQDSITALKSLFLKQKDGKGYQPEPENLNANFFEALGYIGACKGAPNATARLSIANAKKEAEKVIGKVNALFEQPWQEYKAKVEAVKYSLFKTYDKL